MFNPLKSKKFMFIQTGPLQYACSFYKYISSSLAIELSPYPVSNRYLIIFIVPAKAYELYSRIPNAIGKIEG